MYTDDALQSDEALAGAAPSIRLYSLPIKPFSPLIVYKKRKRGQITGHAF
ncbi:MAG: hypothetical protein H6557_24665 [Lewinellaceae bacterium]|nr:hypothetical protein [Phaeodactylibacter sp.]MCB9039825.1 hypothetical protein [Lewinellaceae bacterium]